MLAWVSFKNRIEPAIEKWLLDAVHIILFVLSSGPPWTQKFVIFCKELFTIFEWYHMTGTIIIFYFSKVPLYKTLQLPSGCSLPGFISEGISVIRFNNFCTDLFKGKKIEKKNADSTLLNL